MSVVKVNYNEIEPLPPEFDEILSQSKKIEIIIQETQDETEYLLKDSQLLAAVEDINNHKNLVSLPLESL